MEHPITSETFKVVLASDFDYLAAGEVYRATPQRFRNGKRKGKVASVRFDRDDETSGTSLQPYQWAMLLRQAGVRVEPYTA